MPEGQTQELVAGSTTKELLQARAVQTPLTREKSRLQMAQTEGAVERQTMQLVTPDEQVPWSQIPLTLLKPVEHSVHLLALIQVRQLGMAVVQRSQVKPLRK